MKLTGLKRDKRVPFEMCPDKGTRCSKKGQFRFKGAYGNPIPWSSALFCVRHENEIFNIYFRLVMATDCAVNCKILIYT